MARGVPCAHRISVAQAVAAKDFDTAGELSRNCKSCHRAYKKDE